MKTCTLGLITYLAGAEEVYVGEIYTFTLIDGTILRYTSLDIDITHGGHLYSATTALISRDKIIQSVGTEVGELQITINPRNALINGLAFLQAVRNGVLDGAVLKLERIFFLDWISLTEKGTITLYIGYVSDIDAGRTYCQIKTKSILELLNVPFPRMSYGAPCMWKLYDSGCQATKTIVSGTVASGTITASVIPTSLTEADDFFDLGVIHFTSGACTGTWRTVKSYVNAAGSVALIVPLLSVPAPGDTFDIYPGCDHTYGNTIINTIGNTNGNTIIDGIPDTSGMLIGMVITGQGIPPGTTITLIDSSVQIEISNPAVGTNAGIAITCTQVGTSGCAKFSNQVNFRGCPFIPVPETAT